MYCTECIKSNTKTQIIVHLSRTLTNKNTKTITLHTSNYNTYLQTNKENNNHYTLQTQLRARDFRPSWHPKDTSDKRGKLLGLPGTYTSQWTLGETDLKPNYWSTVAGFSLSTVHLVSKWNFGTNSKCSEHVNIHYISASAVKKIKILKYIHNYTYIYIYILYMYLYIHIYSNILVACRKYHHSKPQVVPSSPYLHHRQGTAASRIFVL